MSRRRADHRFTNAHTGLGASFGASFGASSTPAARHLIRSLVLSLGLVVAAAATLAMSGPSSALAAPQKKAKKDKAGTVKKVPRITPREIKPKEVKPATKAQPTPPETAGPTDAGGQAGELRGPTRIDFDDRLIQGQTNKSGAVYLFDRKETGISSMVRRRKSFRQLTLGTIYDR